MSYGIDKNKIVDREWFWQEVELRAKNNYGDWDNNLHFAKDHVITAMREIFAENKWSKMRADVFMYNAALKMNRIAKDMIE